MKMTNRRNRLIYRLWAPIYDATVGYIFAPGRKQAIKMANLQPGERVLLVGVGTGADLPLLPQGVYAVGVDYSPDMLAKARKRLPLPEREIVLIEGDAQRLLVDENSFDVAIFNLILSVIPDPKACLRENLRALKPDGRVIVFDKFLRDQAKPSLFRRIFNIGSTLFGTDINRRFSEVAAGTEIYLKDDKPSLMNGLYRIMILTKNCVSAID